MFIILNVWKQSSCSALAIKMIELSFLNQCIQNADRLRPNLQRLRLDSSECILEHGNRPGIV